MIDPTTYSITVKRAVVDDESLYRATVAELPDVIEYGETWSEAYELAVDAIETLQKLAEEMGHVFPLPSSDAETDFSGRITLRMPKGLHKKISQRAEAENISLNQYLVSVLAFAAGTAGSYFDTSAAREGEWITTVGAGRIGEAFLNLIEKKVVKVRVAEFEKSIDIPFSIEENAGSSANDFSIVDLGTHRALVRANETKMRYRKAT